MGLMDRHTGKSISDEEHLANSLEMLLTTRIGSRVLNREYGSEIPELVDRNINKQWIIDAYSAIARAISRWEPRFGVTRMLIDASYIAEGVMIVALEGYYKPLGRVVKLRLLTLKL